MKKTGCTTFEVMFSARHISCLVHKTAYLIYPVWWCIWGRGLQYELRIFGFKAKTKTEQRGL